MKKLKTSTFALLALVILFLVGTTSINAVDTQIKSPPAQTEAEWYVQIIDGTLLNSMDVEVESIIVPREISIVSPDDAFLEASTFHLIAPNKAYQDVKDYINNNLKKHPERGVNVTGIAVSSKVFREWLEFNKQQTKIWEPYDQIKIESEKLNLVYHQIDKNLKSKNLTIDPTITIYTFSEITLKIFVGGEDYSLNLNKIIVKDSVNFNSFSLEGTEDIFTVSELNKNNGKEKQINIIKLNSKSPEKSSAIMNNIQVTLEGKEELINLSFKLLKIGQFEIRNNILYSAILNAENIPSTTDAYYYLPQGIVVFPDKGKIDVQFFREGTKNPLLNNGQDQIKVLKAGEFSIYLGV